MQVSQVSGAVPAFGQAAAGIKESGAGFGDIFSRAIGEAKEAEAGSREMGLDVLSGEDVSIHGAMIEMQKAELTLNLTIQVRNKVVEAYNEVMRMQV